MTELQLGLIVLGVFAVCGVLIYNKWQERRHRALAEQVLGSAHQDVLLDTARAEAAPPQAPQAEREAFFAEPGLTAARADAADDDFDAPSTSERPGPVSRLAERFSFGRSKSAESDHEPVAPVTEGQGKDRIEPVLGGSEAEPAGRLEPGWTAASHLEPSPEPQVPAATFEHEVPAPELPRMPAAEPVMTASAPSRTSPMERAEPAAETHHEAKGDVRREGGVGITLSPLIDYVASFEAVEPTSGARILELPREALGRVKKYVQCIGFNETSHEWEKIDVAHEGGQGEYRRFRFGLQLVDRQGPASETDLSVFCVAMQDLADATLSIVDLPQRGQAMKAAADLDAFCAGVDIQIGINVVSQAQPFPGTKLRALAEAAGMTMDIEGRFVRCDEDGNVLYVLVNQEAQPFAPETMRVLNTHALTFLLDVPRVAHGDRVFNQMVDLAKRFADVLRGTVVDDNRRPLSESALDPIRKQIGHYQTLLASSHLPAGSELTRRLFS